MILNTEIVCSGGREDSGSQIPGLKFCVFFTVTEQKIMFL